MMSQMSVPSVFRYGTTQTGVPTGICFGSNPAGRPDGSTPNDAFVAVLPSSEIEIA